MANRIWISSTGDWNATASWSGGVVPVDADVVIFRPSSGVVPPTANLNQDTVQLAELIIEPGVDYPIGAQANPLKITASRVRHYGNGTLCFQSQSSTARVTSILYVDSRDAGGVSLYATAGTGEITTAVFVAGECTMSGAIGLRNLIVAPREKPPGRVWLTLQGAGTWNRAVVLGGSVYSEWTGGPALAQGIPDLTLAGGEWTNAAHGPTEMLLKGGEFIVTGTTGASYTHLYGGLIDTTRDTIPKAIGIVYEYVTDRMRISSVTTVTRVSMYKV